MELHPITVAALEALDLKPDKLPYSRRHLADLVAERNPPETWTADKTAAYRHLCGVVPLRWTKPKAERAAIQSAA